MSRFILLRAEWNTSGQTSTFFLMNMVVSMAQSERRSTHLSHSTDAFVNLERKSGRVTFTANLPTFTEYLTVLGSLSFTTMKTNRILRYGETWLVYETSLPETMVHYAGSGALGTVCSCDYRFRWRCRWWRWR
jgi:hypothetical protein